MSEESKNFDKLVETLKGLKNIEFFRYKKYISAQYNEFGLRVQDSYYSNELPENKDNRIWLDDIERIHQDYVKEAIFEAIIKEDYEELKGVLIVHDFTRSGDYINGGTVALSNCRVLCEDYNHYEVYGGYGFTCASIPVVYLMEHFDSNNDDIDELELISSEDILEIYERLNDYPLISEDDLSQLEMDKEIEAWESWVKDDFEEAINNKFDIELDDYEFKEDKDLYWLFTELMELSNTYYENDDGTDMHIDVDSVVESLTKDKLDEYVKKIEE